MRRIWNIVSKNWLLLLILAVGVFLRFFRFEGFVTFLGDQGRDAIVFQRMISLQHLPAIGAPTSVGQVYLGPFYYYFIAPWLWLFGGNPVGPAFGVAFFSCFYLLANYFIVNEFFDKKTALLSTLFLSLSSVLIDLSRFSWNPNLLPLFTLLSVYFFIKSIKTKKWQYFVLTGSFLSFSIQLHYLALFLIFPVAILYLIEYLKIKKKLLYTKYLILNTASFFFFSSPLLVFDLRHQFLNSNNFIKLFQSSGSTLMDKFKSFFDTFYYLNFYSLYIKLEPLLLFLLIALLFIGFFAIIKEKLMIKTFLFIFLMTMAGMSLYNGEKYPHYFGVLYPLYYILISFFLTSLYNIAWGKHLLALFIFAYTFLMHVQYPFFKSAGSMQIKRARDVAKKIYENVVENKFTLTALPEKYSDSTYRYYLEIWGKKPIEKDSLVRADELFVACEKECSPIMGNPQWDIAYFAPTKIVGQWTIDGVKIYKLVR